MKISTCSSARCWTIVTALAVYGSAALAHSLHSYSGYLLDKQCSDSVRQDSDPRDFIKHHTRDCCLMLNCQRKGYCLFTDGNWLTLDSTGNKLAVTTLRRSKKTSALYVRIQGVVSSGLLKVSSITEIEEPSTKEEPNTKSDAGDGLNAKP